jgi:hypothetical protein
MLGARDRRDGFSLSSFDFVSSMAMGGLSRLLLLSVASARGWEAGAALTASRQILRISIRYSERPKDRPGSVSNLDNLKCVRKVQERSEELIFFNRERELAKRAIAAIEKNGPPTSHEEKRAGAHILSVAFGRRGYSPGWVIGGRRPPWHQVGCPIRLGQVR